MNRLRVAMAAMSLVVAGLCSAGLSHSVVWSLTAMRAIDGPYGAYRHETVVAAMLAAATAAAIIAVIAIACSFDSARRGGVEWFAALHRTIARLGPRRAFLAVYTVQFAAIVAIEATEQFAQFGRTLGVAAALGAPLAVGIAIQALCAIAVVALVFWVARAVVRAESHIRRFLCANVLRRSSAATSQCPAQTYRAADEIARPAPSSLPFANRPPPSIAA